MSPLPPRSILLVGEGNFSFSASLTRVYADTDTSITATCLQHQEEALRHEGAASNVQIILDAGGTVLFGVDCRKLEQCASLRSRLFDCVVFNFPHCGRKSGVKKNRELLKNFFLSCAQVLAEDGEVHVSLCNGQGGTPVDHPKREWHNSWQVASMAAEAHLILTDVRAFESEKYQSYKCTGYRSQDKGFHVEKALLHVFTRSLPYTSAQVLKVEEALDGVKVQYNVPAELSHYIFREFLSSGSVHPVRLVQDFLLKGLADKWSVSMTTEAASFLLTAKQLQECRCDIDSTQFYWIQLLQKDVNYDGQTVTAKVKDLLMDRERAAETGDAPLDKTDRIRSKESECLRSACSFDGSPEEESGLYGLRPSLLPQMRELLAKKEQLISNALSHGENKGNNRIVQVEGRTNDGPLEDCSGVMNLLFGMSGVVFRNVSINLWALPAFHELLLGGVFPLECNPIKRIGKRLETLLAPYGVSLVKEQDGLHLMAQPVGSVGKVSAVNSNTNDKSHVNMNVSLNLDLLAVLFFSLPDWRLLWSHDPRFLKQFASQPSPGQPFHPFSLFPEHFNFDISFWTGPTWEERQFYAVVREASHGTVEHVKLIDSFSHPDLSQTSYCYRLTYHSHTHALSHTQALQFHKHLESLLSSQLKVIIR